MKKKILLVSFLAFLILLIELSRRQGIDTPAPFTLAGASVGFAAILGGLGTGAASAIIVSAYLIYAAFTGFGPSSLTGGIAQASFAVLIFMSIGIGIGFFSDRLRFFRQRAQEHEAELEKHLLLLNSQIKSIFLHSPVVIYLQDTAGRYQFVNKEFSECYGFSSQEIKDKPPHILFPQSLANSFATQVEEVLQNRKANERAYDVVYANGTSHSIISKKFPVLDDDENLLGVGTVDLDVTESKLYQESLIKSEANLNKAQRMAQIGSWNRDIVKDKLLWSENVYRVFGFEPFSFEPDHSIFMDVVHPDDRQMVEFAFQELLEGKPYDIIHRIVLSDGSVRHVRERADVTLDENGEVVQINGTVADITERTRAEQENYELEKQLRQSRKMETIGMLTGGIAHDFNNILTPIAGYVDMARMTLPANDPLAYDMKQVSLGVDRAKDLIQQILLFSRQAEPALAPVDVKDVIIEALDLLRTTIPANINIEQQLDGSYNQVLGDETQIHQVIVNLCTNAAQAMSNEGGTLTVKLEQGSLDAKTAKLLPKLTLAKYLRLSVLDTGPGMDEKTQESIFNPFFTTKKVGSGTGLGLSVVHGIVQSHGGDVRVESEPGKGAAFHVYLPTSDYSEEVSSEERQSLPKGSGLILLVDDEKGNLEVLEKMLNALGYEVDSCSSGEDAFEKINVAPEKYDLLLSDMAMPGITGVELAEKIQQVQPELPIIIMTGFANLLDQETRDRCNIKQLIQKPIKMATLATIVQNVLSQSSTELHNAP